MKRSLIKAVPSLEFPIVTLAQAIQFLRELDTAGCSYHTDDTITTEDTIPFGPKGTRRNVTEDEAKLWNTRRAEMHRLEWPRFCECPCAVLLFLDRDYVALKEREADGLEECHPEDMQTAKAFLRDWAEFEIWCERNLPYWHGMDSIGAWNFSANMTAWRMGRDLEEKDKRTTGLPCWSFWNDKVTDADRDRMWEHARALWKAGLAHGPVR